MRNRWKPLAIALTLVCASTTAIAAETGANAATTGTPLIDALAKGVAKAKELDVKVAIFILDANADILAALRMPGSWSLAAGVARRKALTALFLGKPFANYNPEEQIGNLPFKAARLNLLGRIENPLVAIPGGFPVRVRGKVVAAIGVSGAKVPQDIEVAQACIKAFSD